MSGDISQRLSAEVDVRRLKTLEDSISMVSEMASQGGRFNLKDREKLYAINRALRVQRDYVEISLLELGEQIMEFDKKKLERDRG